ncbi:putative 6-phosphogluconate dehydrogenase [Tilletiaria anomala UBC 951]|uniref:Putative 6-phosphogluconate dehydrogenase n=1 Tax=Tilletiaria anomala (strain ATCC 24038 / CBS 436.72 / UBC 951) TaxID=1037660 RepID=A0A066VUZ2_TILAU|nr:putative 6-phosphogluconate dehydrogenase [Tilletiaria anomala UBC 951]KDN45296.1 putative 6-phosphogluconate dehydrogenase [Tilletiaria anomala UBC 951]
MALSKSVCFVGLGAMGAGMAINIAKSGTPLTVFDIRDEAMQAIVPHGAKASKSTREAAQGADYLVLMVINDAQARQVLFQDGALESLKENGTVLLMSTISPATSAALGKEVEAKGRKYVDCPVSGGAVGANAGSLTLMASAKKSVYDDVEPLLRLMGTNLFHVGENCSAGQSMKAVNQVLCAVHLVAAAEALSFAKASGIDPKVALELMSGSAAQSWFLENRGKRMLQEEPEIKSAVNIIAKDAGIVVNAAREVGAALPLTAQALQIINSSQGRGEGLLDDSQLIRVYDMLNGLRGATAYRK